MKNNILRLFIAGMVVAPLSTIASTDDSQYPATNFQPTVIFADESAQSTTGGSEKSSFDAEFPAANFEPKVLFVDASTASASSTTGERSVLDPNYPAANFEPKVIYP